MIKMKQGVQFRLIHPLTWRPAPTMPTSVNWAIEKQLETSWQHLQKHWQKPNQNRIQKHEFPTQMQIHIPIVKSHQAIAEYAWALSETLKRLENTPLPLPLSQPLHFQLHSLQIQLSLKPQLRFWLQCGNASGALWARTMFPDVSHRCIVTVFHYA